MYLMCSWYRCFKFLLVFPMCDMASIACEFIYPAFVVFWDYVISLWSCELLECVGVSESYFNICVFEQVHDFSYLRTVICKGCRCFVYVAFIGLLLVGFFCCIC
jgi:hypothetical protein